MKIKITAVATNTDAPDRLTIALTTDAEAMYTPYPLEAMTLTITGLIPGSDVTFLAAGTETVLANNEEISGTSVGYVYYTAGSAIDVAVYKPGAIPAYLRNVTLPNQDSSIPLQQYPDPSYLE